MTKAFAPAFRSDLDSELVPWEAADEFDATIAYLAERNPKAARKLAEGVLAAVNRLLPRIVAAAGVSSVLGGAGCGSTCATAFVSRPPRSPATADPKPLAMPRRTRVLKRRWS